MKKKNTKKYFGSQCEFKNINKKQRDISCIASSSIKILVVISKVILTKLAPYEASMNSSLIYQNKM